jgi:HJR/Mrr/RecB family endonuclease
MVEVLLHHLELVLLEDDRLFELAGFALLHQEIIMVSSLVSELRWLNFLVEVESLICDIWLVLLVKVAEFKDT